jgi:hypothetical protein
MQKSVGIRNRFSSPVLFAVLVAFLFGAFSFQLWYHATRTSPTIDEPTHILAGHRYWQCRDFGVNPEHPPFVKLLATASLNFQKLIEPDSECGSRITKQAEVFAGGAEFLIENGIDEVIVPARLLSALLSLLLAALIFVVTLKMFGRWEAAAALALLAFEPNIIAHGSLVTTDMAITLTAFAAVCALYGYARKPRWIRIATIALTFGMMLASKHSAVIFFPILFVTFLADAIFFRRDDVPFLKKIAARCAVFAGAVLIGVGILWSFYGFQRYALPGVIGPSVDIAEYIRANSLPDVPQSFSAKSVRVIDRLGILPESYVIGLADVVASSSRPMAIFSRDFSSGRWFYFPIAFLVKSSIALLLLLPFGVVLFFVEPGKRRELIFILVPAISFFGFAVASKINIGVRHILPAYAFFVVASAAGAVWMGRRFIYFRYALVALLLFHALTAFRTAPNYIAFSNDLWGGTENTYKIFPVDSNLDWGQNEKLVAEYLARENITDCWYAGWGSLELLTAQVPCRQMPSTFPRLNVPLSDPIPRVIEGTVLVNVANLPPRGGNEYAPMTLQKPIAKIGGSIFVYRGRFEIPLGASISLTQRATELMRLDRIDEALIEAQRAVDLADYDPRPHLALGYALLRTGNSADARGEFESVIETARSNPLLFNNAAARARLELEKLDRDE